jgi:predicted RNase H-like nuclease/predicted enzyme related to lactoylglutathione lyase
VTNARLLFVRLRVRDLDAAAAFYRDAFGISLVEDGNLCLASIAAPEHPTRNVEIGLLVDDLDASHLRAVAAGAEVVREPRDEPSGRTSTYSDPEGNLVTLTQGPRPSRVAGVDLAGGGWAVVVLDGNRVVDAFRCESFADALLVDAEFVGVDIPIGIPVEGTRPADAEARRFVGPRASSVFTTPLRPVLEAPTYAEARRLATELTGKSVTAQTYALAKRILEVDEHAERDERVIEVHPEASFRELARRPLESKHRSQGLAERRALLEQAGIDLPPSVPRIAEPDLLDATVVAWSASRYARGEAVPLPDGHTDRIGAIWR